MGIEVLNGHNRLRVLRSIGHESARCVIWHVDDAQARLYLATLNRLAGTDVPERRAALLESLLGTFDVDELAGLLPEERGQIEELERLARLEPAELVPAGAWRAQTSCSGHPRLFLEEAEAKEVNLALDPIRASDEEKASCSQALVLLARFSRMGLFPRSPPRRPSPSRSQCKRRCRQPASRSRP